MDSSSPSSSVAYAPVASNLKSLTFDTPKQNLRGLNKPKCSKCGNVARSRCPFQSCKSCCAKAQNPCPIHVLKQSGILPDKPPSSSVPFFEPQLADAPSCGASWRLTSLRQLSAAVANSLRSRKPLTRKDAISVNKWRFSKLREHIEGNIEVENEAFERYLYNVGLLEEAFSAKALNDISEDEIQKIVPVMKSKLKSSAKRADAIRKRRRNLVNEKLRKLKEWEQAGFYIVSASTNNDALDAYRALKMPKQLDSNQTMKSIEMDNLVDKLSKARNKDDLIGCMKPKAQLLGYSENESPNDKCGGVTLPKLCTPAVRAGMDLIFDENDQITWATQLAEL